MFKLIRKYSRSADAIDDSRCNAVEVEMSSMESKHTVTFESLKSRIIAPGKDLSHFAASLLSLLAKEMEFSQGVFFITEKKDDKKVLKFLSGYAYDNEDKQTQDIEFGEGFTGQVASEGKPMIINDVPQGYLSIVSGLGSAAPASIIIIPVIDNKETLAVIELASFHRFTPEDESVLLEVASYISGMLKKTVLKN